MTTSAIEEEKRWKHFSSDGEFACSNCYGTFGSSPKCLYSQKRIEIIDLPSIAMNAKSLYSMKMTLLFYYFFNILSRFITFLGVKIRNFSFLLIILLLGFYLFDGFGNICPKILQSWGWKLFKVWNFLQKWIMLGLS